MPVQSRMAVAGMLEFNHSHEKRAKGDSFPFPSARTTLQIIQSLFLSSLPDLPPL